MAILLGLHDLNPERRLVFSSRVPGNFAQLPGRRVERLRLGNTLINVERAPSAPLSFAQDAQQPARGACILGDFLPERFPGPSGNRPAQYLLEQAAAAPLRPPQFISGQNRYYLAILQNEANGISLATDALGLFPLYVYQGPDFLLFGTSPELFRIHPDFPAVTDLYAVVSVLMYGMTLNERAIYRGVRRNRPGHMFTWNPGQPIREIEANGVKPGESHFGRSFESVLDESHHILDRAAAGLATAHSQIQIILSGGADSRILLGLLARHLPTSAISALTLGGASHTDVRYAKRAAHAYKISHRTVLANSGTAVDNFVRRVGLESLGSPIDQLDRELSGDLCANGNLVNVNGFSGGNIHGASIIESGLDIKTGELTFARARRHFNRMGFKETDIGELLFEKPPSYLIEEVNEDLKNLWDSIDGHAYQKAWLFGMYTRDRYYLSALHWNMCHDSWNIAPFMERALIDLISSAPANFIRHRRLQFSLLRRHLPMLAQIPLARGNGRPYRLLPSKIPFADVRTWNWQTRSWRVQTLMERWVPTYRYSYHAMSLEQPAWKAVRKFLEPIRLQPGLLNPVAIARHWPESGQRFDDKGKSIDTYKPKLLMALQYMHHHGSLPETENGANS